MYSKSILSEIRDRISIASFIGERIPLKRAGRNMKGLCPFHNEKTSSFMVSDDKGIYHCFGCGEGGDIFRFVMKFDGIDFAESVKFLAGRTGIELPKETYDPKQKDKEDAALQKKRYAFRINEIARDYFHGLLVEQNSGAAARSYLEGRGIKKEFFTQLFLGFADNNWEGLAAHLKKKGAPLDLAAELGLVKQRDGGGYYDFFRNRIIFPIVSPRGEILGFGGREFGEETGAKYLNSPDSIIYHKSNCLYGLDRAKDAIRSEDRAVFVEGYMDQVMLAQNGIINAVAPLGTALTTGHLKLISRQTRNLVVVFDGDEAGKRATMRSLEIFLEIGLSPRVAPLPAGEDPDTLVRKEGEKKFRKRIEDAVSLFEYFVDQVIGDEGSDASGRVAASGRIVPILKLVSDPTERSIYRRYAAQRLNVDEKSLEKSIGFGTGELVKQKKFDKTNLYIRNAERLLIESLLGKPEIAEAVFTKISPEDFEDDWYKTIAAILLSRWREEGTLNMGELIESLSDLELASELRKMSIENSSPDENEIKELVGDCIIKLKERPKILRLATINDEIRQAEMTGDEDRLMELLTEKKTLAGQIKGGHCGNDNRNNN